MMHPPCPASLNQMVPLSGWKSYGCETWCGIFHSVNLPVVGSRRMSFPPLKYPDQILTPSESTFKRRMSTGCVGEAVKKLESSAIPLLASVARRGGRAIQKISRSIRLSRGRGGFPMNPKGKQPRLLLLRWLRPIFFDDAATPPFGGAAVVQGGE